MQANPRKNCPYFYNSLISVSRLNELSLNGNLYPFNKFKNGLSAQYLNQSATRLPLRWL